MFSQAVAVIVLSRLGNKAGVAHPTFDHAFGPVN